MELLPAETMPRASNERIWIIVTQVERRGGQVTKLPHFCRVFFPAGHAGETNHPNAAHCSKRSAVTVRPELR